MPPNERSTEPTFAGTWGIAALLWLPGLVMITAALGWIPCTAAGFHAPHWVVFAAGMTFLAGGFGPFLPRLAPGSWMPRAVAAGVVWPLTAIANWTAFAPGPRQFSGAIAIGGVGVSTGAHSEIFGRIVFGFCAVVLDGIAAAMLLSWLKRR